MSGSEKFKQFLTDLESGTVDFEATRSTFLELMQLETNKEHYEVASRYRDIKDYCEERIQGLPPARRVHSEFPFKHGDKVGYNSNEGFHYCMLTYVDYLGAFILVHFTDETFTEPIMVSETKNKTDMLFEIGIDVLEMLEL